MRDLVVTFIVAFLFAALPGKWAIERLRKLGAKQTISEDAPTAHGAKQGTPTMGGLLILVALTLTILVYAGISYAERVPEGRGVAPNSPLWSVLLLTLAFGVIGFIDDFLSARRGKNLGFRAREKFAAQCLVAIGFVFYLSATAQPGTTTFLELAPTQVMPPIAVDLSFWYYPLAVLFLVAFSNATNFTDGLDGLSSGVTLAICIAVSALVAVLTPVLGIFTMALAGALAGFLWWNAHPAKVFMGDTGSLALGAALGGVALLGKQEIGLIIASLVCWAELFSVIIQVSVFKWRRRRHGLDYAKSHRVFRRTPLHHHFEEIGWAETQIVTRFWIVGALCAGLAMLWSRH